ncbi:hemolysin XhlA family protein [Amphibacillus sp. Q70]|uniref:hemolysin XhlA family protein n=1 Tax=Amphibacillus sp. Q70 TaxID=3453416 RepID=UPI003F833CD7
MEDNDMDIWRNGIQRDVSYLKSTTSKLKDDVANLKVNDKIQDQKIGSLERTLDEIKEDTSWIRRKVTGALITTIVTAVVGGIIGIAIYNIF